jgi:hypothetical protein
MKSLRLAFLALAASALLLAQTVTPRVVAEVPFEFEMANLKLPAGEYEVTEFTARPALHIRNYDAGRNVLANTNILSYEATATQDIRLVFNKYGERYFLSEIWYPHIARIIPKSKTERELVTSTLITRNVERVVIYARAF